MKTVTVSEFSKEMDRIDKIQDEVNDILYNRGWLYKMFFLGKARKLHNEAGQRMNELWSKDLIVD
jgi:hypothetical protein